MDQNEADIQELAGTGRTTETVKKNADDIVLVDDASTTSSPHQEVSDRSCGCKAVWNNWRVVPTCSRIGFDAIER